MEHELNYESNYKDYFVNEVDYNSYNSFYNKMKLSAKIIYSLEAKHKIRALIKKSKPDIAHIHMFQHQLSLSILYEIKKNGIPIVYTTHDLKCMCPNYKMLCKGKICESCKDSKYYNCFLNRCVKDSRSKSLLSTVEMYIHHFLKIYDLVDVFVAPSKFFRDKLVEYGFSSDKILYIPNFLDAGKYQPSYSHKNYFIYLGRLSEEKGILTLVEAMKAVDTTSELRIIGTGPVERDVAELIERSNLQNKVRLLGFKSGTELAELIKNAMFGVIPSECYENAPYAALEMMAYGKPIIGANVGGIPELIDNEKTGMIFRMGDPQDLAIKINKLATSSELLQNYGKNARNKLEETFNSTIHYQEIYHTYQTAVDRQRRSR